VYIIQLILKNPMASGPMPVSLNFQFDPATLDAAKWASAFPTVQAALAGLVADSVGKEPTKW
jgi:hypothetical protein